MKDESVKSAINLNNSSIAEEMYDKFLKDPKSVDSSWHSFFNELDEIPTQNNIPNQVEIKTINLNSSEESRLIDLIQAFRTYGHLAAKINPILNELQEVTELPCQLKAENYGFEKQHLDKIYPTFQLLPEKNAPLSQIIERLKTVYAGKIGVEYMGIQNLELEKFIQDRLESRDHLELTLEEKQMILKHLNKSELLEIFLHTKYVGQKRFSLEGGETLIPMIEDLIEKGAKEGIEEFFIGMSHRGRLNVLANILNKSYSTIFSEFDESYIPNSFEGSGDVKYHKGFVSEVTVGEKKVKISLTPNPSHLESVDAVVEGQVKARQVALKSVDKVIPILVHGDAALSGQGVVYETLQFCKLPGYSTGGTLHFVVNNQIGFTTLPKDSRSTRYCTDIAKTFGAPVFHVNGDDPESAVFVTNLALEIRQKFKLDVFIDLNCYRKYGHNETDEPAFTQPLEYQIVRKKRPVREIYTEQLIEKGFLEKELAEKLEQEFRKSLEEAQDSIKILTKNSKEIESEQKEPLKFSHKTAVTKELLVEIANRLSQIPDGFNIHPKVKQLVLKRFNMIVEDKSIDWGAAETLSYATLLWEGVNVRISGQDCCRGTFSHRHGLYVDQVKEKDYFPLKHLKEDQGRFDLLNSPLSEFAVLGFEYGYNMMSINDLTIWEAQFGDFANGAQIIIDQYIASAEQKWGQKSSLVLLLPHGYEGQGPEHSSARLERFLSLTGNENMQIVYPTTPAQLFHLLRLQILGKIFKPLIIFSPKGLLRHPECVSQVKDFTEGSFSNILDDNIEVEKPKRLIFCSGRIYYDLSEMRKKNNVTDIVMIRIEQLYPLDTLKLKEMIGRYSQVEQYIYAQEEPSNMGAWDYIRPILAEIIPNGKKLEYLGRKRSASPATGSHARHKEEHASIMSIMGSFSKK